MRIETDNRKHAVTTETIEKQSVLYDMWRSMTIRARQDQAFYDKIKENRCVLDDSFRDFYSFRVWAVYEQGYPEKTTKDAILIRIDPHGDFTPDNCRFAPNTDDVKVAACIPLVSHPDGYKKLAELTAPDRDGHDQNGLSNTRLYEIWKGMRRRCNDMKCKDYPDYGGRGIRCCDEWDTSFRAFYDWAWEHGYHPQLSLDRIDVNGNYCPENCRWASDLEQRLNKRSYDGIYQNVRLNVGAMIELLKYMASDVIVTLIVNSKYLPAREIVQIDYPPVPEENRVDVIRKKGKPIKKLAT